MFVRVKKTGNYKYLQIVQTYREGKKVKQRVVSTLGRLDPVLHMDYVNYCKRMKNNKAIVRIACKLLDRVHYVLKNFIRAKFILSPKICDNVANKMVFLFSALMFMYP